MAETGSSPYWLIPEVNTLKNSMTGGNWKRHVKDSPGFPSAILLAVVLAYIYQCTLHVMFLLFVHIASQNHLIDLDKPESRHISELFGQLYTILFFL